MEEDADKVGTMTDIHNAPFVDITFHIMTTRIAIGESKLLLVQMSFVDTWLTSLSHDPVTKMSGCCKVDCDTGRHLVLLIFWDTYLAFMLSMR